MTDFRCEDFPGHGVILVPPTSPEYDSLVADIRSRAEHRVAGSPPTPDAMRPQIRDEDRETSVILVNRSAKGIAAIQQLWTFEDENGRRSTSAIGGAANPSVLLPFGIPERFRKLYGYWHVILPGSKRYLTADGEQVGGNCDVRPPEPDGGPAA
jgi:hypothetical protein